MKRFQNIPLNEFGSIENENNHQKSLGNSQNIQKMDNFIQKDIHNPKLKFWGVTYS